MTSVTRWRSPFGVTCTAIVISLLNNSPVLYLVTKPLGYEMSLATTELFYSCVKLVRYFCQDLSPSYVPLSNMTVNVD